MKRIVVSCMILSAFMLVLTGVPFQLLHIDVVKSAYAYIAYSQNHGWDNIRSQDNESDKIRGQEHNQYNNLDIGNNGNSGDRHEKQDQGNDGEHGDSHNILISGHDLNKILGSYNKKDDQGQEDNEENNWGQFDDWKKFKIKDDDCKDFRDYDKDWHKNWGKNEDGDKFWKKDKNYDCDDGCDHHKHDNCKVPEPSMFSLLGVGIAGVGVYSFIKRRYS